MKASFIYLLFLVLIIIANCDKLQIKRRRYDPKSCQDKAPRYCKSKIKKSGCQGLIAKVACKMTCERCKTIPTDTPKPLDKKEEAANSSLSTNDKAITADDE